MSTLRALIDRSFGPGQGGVVVPIRRGVKMAESEGKLGDGSVTRWAVGLVLAAVTAGVLGMGAWIVQSVNEGQMQGATQTVVLKGIADDVADFKVAQRDMAGKVDVLASRSVTKEELKQAQRELQDQITLLQKRLSDLELQMAVLDDRKRR